MNIESKSKIKEQIAERQRAAILAFMKSKGIESVTPWCKKAGITEGALRNFLNGDNDSMNSSNLELLAIAADSTIGEMLGSGVAKSEGALHEQMNGMLSLLKTLFMMSLSKYKFGQDDVVDVLKNLEGAYRLQDKDQAADVVKKIQVFASEPPHEVGPLTIEQLLTFAPAGRG